MKTLRNILKDYISMRRALGFKLRNEGAALPDFVSFLEREGASYITTDLALRWAKRVKHAQPAQWSNRLSFVRNFAKYCSALDPRTEIPSSGLLPRRNYRPMPYIYTNEEIRQLLDAAKNLPPKTGLRRWTYYTLFGLLVVTGLRISEAIALDREDVDLKESLLTIRYTKFNKSRLVPIHTSTRNKLKQYDRRRNALHRRYATPTFFVSDSGKPLNVQMVRYTFVKLSCQIGLREASDRFGPRIHDIRHSFATNTLINWYQSGVDVERRLPTLSTFLGHTRVNYTYWYLSAVPELLALTGKRLEKRWEDLL